MVTELLEKSFCDICGDCSAKRRIKPINVTLLIFFIWLVLVLLKFNLKSVYPLSLRAVSETFLYRCLDELGISSLQDFLYKHSLIVFGNLLIICGEWPEDFLIFDNKSFGFLCGDMFIVASATLREKRP